MCLSFSWTSLGGGQVILTLETDAYDSNRFNNITATSNQISL